MWEQRAAVGDSDAVSCCLCLLTQLTPQTTHTATLRLLLFPLLYLLQNPLKTT